MEAVRLMKAGMRKEAETQLRKAYERVKNDPEPAYNVEMALVEILIAQVINFIKLLYTTFFFFFFFFLNN